MNLEGFGETRNQRRFSKIAASVFDTAPVDVITHKLLVQPGYVAVNKSLIGFSSYQRIVGSGGYTLIRDGLFIIGDLKRGWYVLSIHPGDGSMERLTFGRACRAMQTIIESGRSIKGVAPTIKNIGSLPNRTPVMPTSL
jgi:hypothetical protein